MSDNNAPAADSQKEEAAATDSSRREQTTAVPIEEKRNTDNDPFPDDVSEDPDEDEEKKEGEEDKKKEEEEEKPTVTMGELFQYADCTDRALMIIGGICAFIAGAGMPSFSEVFGRMVDELTKQDADYEKTMGDLALIMIYIGLAIMVLCAIQTMTWMVASERQITRIRALFFDALLRQEPAFHDENKPGELTSRLSGDTKVIKMGINDKVPTGIMNFGMFIFGYGFGFYRSWELTLLMLGTLPLLALVGVIMTAVLTSMTSLSRAGYAKAGAVADEVLSNIRTVQIFGTENTEVERFDARLGPAADAGVKKEFATTLGMGFSYMVMFASYALAFWFSSYLIEWGRNTVGEITAVFFAVLIGSFGLGLMFPTIGGLFESMAAAHPVYAIINRKPAIANVDAPKVPKRIDNLQGAVEFHNVRFSYPTRKDEKLFTDLSVRVEAGTSVAFSGPSGCGKSSVVALVQRQYDPIEGHITVDGIDLRDLDLEWWRSQIGVVSQEPNLFSGSIADNIKLGKPDATPEEIEDACRKANIHDTIMTLSDGYATPVGNVGSQLSGGQKQRIAIARAIVKKPKLLILDEATSALDRQSEMEVQAALDQLMNEGMQKRTTFVIAHRLVTIRDVTKIFYVVNDGNTGSAISESGSYDELIAKQGDFYSMASRQSKSAAVVESALLESQASETMKAAAEAEADPTNSGTNAPVMLHTAPAEQGKNSSFAGGSDNKTENKSFTNNSMASAPAEPQDLSEVVKAEETSAEVPLVRLVKLTSEKSWAVVLGLLGSLVSGGLYPAYAVVLAKMLEVLGRNDAAGIREKTPFWAGMFLVIAAAALIGWFLQGFYGVAGEFLTRKLRRMLFVSILGQDQTFFDMPGRDPGGLCGSLSGDTEAIHLLWGPSIGYKVQMACNLTVGLTIGFIYSWKLALVTLSVVPIMIVTGAVQQMMMVGFGKDEESEDTIVSECLTNIRTVAAFNATDAKSTEYKTIVVAQEAVGKRNGVIAGIVFGISQFSFYGVFALAFWYGGTLMAKGELSFSDVMITSMAILMGAMGAGEAGGFASKSANSAASAQKVFAMIDRKPGISADAGGKAVDFDGPAQLNFHNVKFIYPARPKAVVLKRFSGSFPGGHKIGLMGSTGCGKSTIIQLLARYYDPVRGRIEVNGTNLAHFDLKSWRANMSVVLQEPALFAASIMKNIKYARPDATDAEVHEVAKLACIHDDIMAMKRGYKTNAGYKGRKLSGGQKQRVAIARALLRRPKLLLLDEATSALDNATEAAVQEGIDTYAEKYDMTIVSIAHRLTTIRHSNTILLLDAGVVLEQGSHDELMDIDGEYKVRWETYQAGMK